MGSSFSYRVIDPAGRKLSGVLEASNEAQALNRLQQRGDTVLELKETDLAGDALKLETRSRLTDQELADFAADLKSLMETGASLPRALGVLSEGRGAKSIIALARDLKLQLELGRNASDVLIASKSDGARLLGRFLHAAETAGRYEIMLGIAADFLTKRSEAFAKIRSALSYPIFLMVVAILAIGFLVIYVAPSIAPLFEGQDAPAFIVITAGIGEAVQSNNRAVLLGAAGIVLVIFAATKTGVIQRVMRWCLYRTPFVRGIALDLDFGPLALALGALTGAGWPADRALSLASDLSSGLGGEAFRRVASNIRDGATLAKSFEKERIVPHELVRAVSLGETSGNVANTVSRTGDLLIRRALKQLDHLSTILGPIMIVGIGGLVASLMISLLSSLSALGDVALQ